MMTSMNRFSACAVTTALAAFAVNAVSAAPVLSLSDESGDPQSVTIAPGDSFSIDVTLNSDQTIVGFSYFLEAPTEGSGLFSITARTTADGNPMTEKITEDDVVTEPANAPLDPRNGTEEEPSDLGYFTDLELTDLPAGTYEIDVLTLTSDATIPVGTYTISIADASWVDGENNEGAITPGSYTVIVVPEPGTVALLLGTGLLPVLLPRRRR